MNDAMDDQCNAADKDRKPVTAVPLEVFVYPLFCILIGLLVMGLFSTRLQAKASSPQDLSSSPTLRYTPSGELVGIHHDAGGDAWLGIPYAEPPVGERRWAAPVPISSWQGIRRADSYGSSCSQHSLYHPSKPVQGGEDCLYLNIWSPRFETENVPTGDERLPVMVWVHGGSNVLGTGNTYDGGILAATQRAIVITINYRLGVFGWFYHPALSDPEGLSVNGSGNYALLDIIQALQWIKTHALSFGGDPERVTVFGESAGASNIYALLVSPLSKGLFQRAIIQSGSTSTMSTAQASHYVDDCSPGVKQSSGELLLQLIINDGKFTTRHAAKRWVADATSSQVAAYLRSKSATDFYQAVEAIQARQTDDPLTSWFPQQFRDGTVLPTEGITGALQHGRYHAIPMILGSTRDEFSLLLSMNPLYAKRSADSLGVKIISPSHYQLAAEYLSKMLKARSVDEPANIIARQQSDGVFVYRFDWDQLSPAPWLNHLSLGATHGLDVPFVFGHRNLGPEFFQLSLMRKNSLPSYRALSTSMMSYWVQFATTGDPGHGKKTNLPQWENWSPSAKHQNRTMHFDSIFEHHLRMSPLKLDSARVLEQLERDSHVKALPEKEKFLDNLFSTMRSLGLLESDTETCMEKTS